MKKEFKNVSLCCLAGLLMLGGCKTQRRRTRDDAINSPTSPEEARLLMVTLDTELERSSIAPEVRKHIKKRMIPRLISAGIDHVEVEQWSHNSSAEEMR